MATKLSAFLISLVVMSLVAITTACESETSPCSSKEGLPTPGNILGAVNGNVIPKNEVATTPCESEYSTTPCGAKSGLPSPGNILGAVNINLIPKKDVATTPCESESSTSPCGAEEGLPSPGNILAAVNVNLNLIPKKEIATTPCESETSTTPCSTKGGLLATGNVFGVDVEGKLKPLEGAIVTLVCKGADHKVPIINHEQRCDKDGHFTMSKEPNHPILSLVHCLLSVLESSLPLGFNAPVSHGSDSAGSSVSPFTIPTPTNSPYNQNFYYTKY